MTRSLCWIIAGLAVLIGSAAGAGAIPPGGASPDTAGTSASVSPATLSPGDRISFTVRGFPAGETLYIKIDDGKNCADTTQGGCVFHQQAIPSSGVVSGAFDLPDSISVGKHWLRFLASEQIFNADGSFKGVKGYTRRGGGEFTIVAATNSQPGAQTQPSPDAGSMAPTPADPAAPVGESSASLGPIEVAPSASVPSTETGDEAPTVPQAVVTSAPVTTAAAPADDPFPVIGVIVLGLAVAASAFALGLVVARSGRAG